MGTTLLRCNSERTLLHQHNWIYGLQTNLRPAQQICQGVLLEVRASDYVLRSRDIASLRDQSCSADFSMLRSAGKSGPS
jgi:hypothetical protein